MGLHVYKGSSGNGFLTDDNTTSLREAVVDSTDSVFGALDLDQENGFLESRLRGKLRSVEGTSSSRDNLTTTSVDSIGMEGNIMDVESDTSHVFFCHDTFFGGPLESSLEGVLDFVEVLDGLGDIDKQVGTGCLGSEAPDLKSIIWIPFVFISEHDSASLGILLRSDLLVINSLGKFITEGCSSEMESVVLVG